MVIVRLNGGFGNQLFQYATGRRLSQMHNVPLRLDITAFEKNKTRKYELDALKITAGIADPAEIFKLRSRWCTRRSPIIRMARLLFTVPRLQYVHEKHFHFDPGILELSRNVYMEGFWQSEKYFSDISPIIREEYKVEMPFSKNHRELAEYISSVNSVSLHVRRGDYVAEKRAMKTLGALPLGYYGHCVKRLSEKVPNPCFFIFSDDPEWCQENCYFGFRQIIVSRNDGKPYEDIRLMSLCKHHIIANSSFSWWGAWLSESADKLVYAPKRWFANNSYDTKDLIPEGWISI